jgi:hypothetical protein
MYLAVSKILELCQRCCWFKWPSPQCFSWDSSRKSNCKLWAKCLSVSYFKIRDSEDSFTRDFFSVQIIGENLFFFQVRIMRKRLVRKTFDMIEEIAEKEDKEVQLNLCFATTYSVYLMLKLFSFFCRTTRSSGKALASLSSLVAFRTQEITSALLHCCDSTLLKMRVIR